MNIGSTIRQYLAHNFPIVHINNKVTQVILFRNLLIVIEVHVQNNTLHLLCAGHQTTRPQLDVVVRFCKRCAYGAISSNQ